MKWLEKKKTQQSFFLRWILVKTDLGRKSTVSKFEIKIIADLQWSPNIPSSTWLQYTLYILHLRLRLKKQWVHNLIFFFKFLGNKNSSLSITQTVYEKLVSESKNHTQLPRLSALKKLYLETIQKISCFALTL